MPKTNAPEKTPAKQEDVVLVHGRTDDGEGHVVLRKRGDTVALGEVRKVREGQPIHGELVRLSPRANQPHLADVEVLHSPEAVRGGPARVATKAYREGWSQIFDEKKAGKASRARLSN